MTDGVKSAWERFESDIQGLAAELKRNYRSSGDANDNAELNRSLGQLREAAEAVFKSLETTTKDPDVRAKTKETARSFGSALAATFRGLGEEIEKAAKR